MEGNRFSLQKLSNSNYPTWRFKVELLLVREELWRYVDPGVQPAGETDAVWNAGDAKARATIGLLIEDNQHGLIRASRTAHDAWMALQNHHQKTSLTSKVSLLKRICDKRFADGDDMAEHLFEMEELFSRLANAGQELEENLTVAMILRSLPSSYDTLTTALESRSDDDLTLELVKRKLLDEAAKRQSAGSSSALKVGHDYRKKKPIVCHYCKKAGHKQSECRKLARDSPKEEPKRQEKAASKKNDTVSFALATGGEADNSGSKPWVVDSGATRHTVADRKFFRELRESDIKFVNLADGKQADVRGEGPCMVESVDEQGRRREMNISFALFVPSLSMNLLSVPALVQKQATVVFDAAGCRILRGDATIAVAHLKNGLYQIKQPEDVVMVAGGHHNKDCQHVWHRRFGHRDPKAIDHSQKAELVDGLVIRKCNVDESCDCCLKGKTPRTPFPAESLSKSKAPMDLVHTDVCGPVEMVSVSGYRYFMTMIDDHSRYCVVYFLKEKSEVPTKIEEYVAHVKTLFGRKPKAIRSDQGGEYSSKQLRSFYKREGISVQYTAGYSPQQNGIAERKNRSLIEMVRCMLFDARMEQRYWAEALSTAVHLQNILPTKPLDATPYELWTGVKPKVDHLRIFGCSAWVHIPKVKRKKLDATAQKLTFVGYSPEHKAYRFLDRATRKVYVSRDARFIENEAEMDVAENDKESEPVFFDVGRRSDRATPDSHFDAEEAEEYDSAVEDVTQSDGEFRGFSDEEPLLGEDVVQQDAPRRSTRPTKGVPPQRFCDVTSVTKHTIDEPRNFSEAVNGPEAAMWQAAMQEEMEAFKETGTWELVPLPPGRKPVGCKWTYKKKEDEHGRVVRHKARLVAQGFSQKFGQDYDEVFAPVVRQTTLRTILVLASKQKMSVKHLDIKSAYLYADLEEDTYMKQPPGFDQNDGRVCRLKRCIYGLKQSARAWNKKIDRVFKSMGFEQAESDTCLYIRNRKGKQSYILIYVDDMLVVCNSEEEFEEIRRQLQNHFKLSCLGDLKQFLGIRVEKAEDHYTLDQATYIDRLVRRFGHDEAKPSKVPMDPAYLKQKEECELPTNTSYRSLVGSLLYIAVNTRPDICVAVSLLGRKVANPTNRDWTEAKRVLRYLKATRDHRLHLGPGTGEMECYVDADWAGDEDDRKSHSGFLLKFGGGLVDWGTRKQSCVALSSTEAEFIALADGCQQLMWYRKLLNDLQQSQPSPIVIWEDNQSCIKIVESERLERRSKHIDTKYAYAKDLHQQRVIELRYMPTERMEADLMTKPLDRVKLERHRTAIGVKDPTKMPN